MRYLEGVILKAYDVQDHTQYVDVMTSEGVFRRVTPPLLSPTGKTTENGAAVYSSVQVPLNTRCLLQIDDNQQPRIIAYIPKTRITGGVTTPPEENEDPGDVKFYRSSGNRIVSGLAATKSLAMMFVAGYSDPENESTQDFYRLGLFAGESEFGERKASTVLEGIAPKIQFRAANSFLEMSEAGTRTCVVSEEETYNSFMELNNEGKLVLMGTCGESISAFTEINGGSGEINLATKSDEGASWLQMKGNAVHIGLGSENELGLHILSNENGKEVRIEKPDRLVIEAGAFVLEMTPEKASITPVGSSTAAINILRDNESRVTMVLNAELLSIRATDLDIDTKKNLNILNPGFKLSASGDPNSQGSSMQMRDLVLVVDGEGSRIGATNPITLAADLQITNKASLQGYRLVHIQELYALLDIIAGVFNTHTQLFGEGLALPPAQQIVLPHNI